MLELGSVFISSLITAISLFYTMKIILKSETSLIDWRTIASITTYASIITATYSTQYNVIKTILFYLIMIVIYRWIFKMSVSKSLLVVSLAMIVFLIADASASKIILTFIEVADFRGIWINTLLGNITVGLLAYKIVSINKVKSHLNSFIEKMDNGKIYDRVVFVLLMIFAWIIIIYNLIITSNLGIEYILNLISIVIFIIMCVIYIYEKIQNQKIKDKYDGLLNYVQGFEELMDKEQLANHEHKNQLATLRFMVKGNKKAEKYIDEIIGELNEIENKYSSDMKNIPKGIIKGLLYYKIVIAESNKIDTYVNVTKPVYNYLAETTEQDLKKLSHLIGIYMDNAIEAAATSEEKRMSVELYLCDSSLKVVISNTYNGYIDKNKIKTKGYSTKGQNRGKGLYFAGKLINQDIRFCEVTNITEKYYCQTFNFEKEKIV